MKKLQLWSICLLILAVLTMAVSCTGPSGDGTNTTETNETVTTSAPANEDEPAETNDSQPTNTSEPDNGTTAPEETKADIRPGKDEDHDWEGYQPFP